MTIITLQTVGRSGHNYDYNYAHTADHGGGLDIIILTLQTMGRAGYNYDYNYTHTADHGEGWV